MIQVQNLTAGYEKNKTIIEDMSFNVQRGEIFGFLGPSGAGKSTLQKVIIGMLSDYKGNVYTDGIECRKRERDFFERIGVDFEYSTMYEKLTARQNLKFFASLYNRKCQDIDSLLDSLGLLKDADKPVSDYSKGMKSRLNFAKAVLHNPDLLCLDEPTSGLDPTNNSMMKKLILAQKEKGTTVLLTTHNMADATELCDRVAFIVNGKILALDSPHNLIMKRGASKVVYTWQEDGEKTDSCEINQMAEDNQLQTLILENRLTSIHSTEPTLNDLFMLITGKSLV